MTTKDDPTLDRVFDKFFPLLHELGDLREELPQSDLKDLQYFLDTFDEWDQHPTARRMFEVEAAFREPSSVSDRDIIARYMERVRECSLETFRLLAEHEDTEVLGTALRVFPWERYAEQKQIVQEVLSGRGIGTPAQVSGQGVVMESKVFDGTVETESPTVSETPGGLDKGAVQTGGLDKGAVQSRRSFPSRTVPPGESMATPELRAEGAGATRSDANIGQASETSTAMPVEPRLSRSNLTADLTLRISLSAPGVREKRDESQAELKALLKALNGVHGHDAGKDRSANSQEVPLSEEQLQLMRSVVTAAIALQKPGVITGRILDALRSLFLILEEINEHIDTLSNTASSLKGLAVKFGAAYLAYKGLMVTLGEQ